MSFTAQMVDSLRAARRWIRERDEARGFSVSYKRIALAFAIEFAVIGTSLYGALMFARMYGSGDVTAKHMMMLAPSAMPSSNSAGCRWPSPSGPSDH
jgi:hypothetical protein